MRPFEKIKAGCMIVATGCLVALTYLSYLWVREMAFEVYSKAFWKTLF
jgi:hypothetical protein